MATNITTDTLVEILRTALPGAKIGYGDRLGFEYRNSVNEGPKATQSLGRGKLRIRVELLWDQDGGCRTCARILGPGDYVFEEFGDVLDLTHDDLHNVYKCAGKISDEITLKLRDLATDINMLADMFHGGC